MLAAQKIVKKISIMKCMALFILLSIVYISNAQNVGIGTTTPLARLYVTDSAVLFTGPPIIISPTIFDPPASGAGSRMMWYSAKAAFRVGTVNGTDWDKDNIGNQSFAGGFNTKAAGFGSFSMGSSNISSGSVAAAIGYNNNASGDAAMILGTSSTASGFTSTSIGTGNFAIGNYAISMGSANWAVADNSIAMGTSNVTRAVSSTALGYHNVALSPNSLVIGAYNDTTLTDKLFEIGNGSFGARSNALTVLRNGNMGIGITNPTNLLTFAAIGGKKISLFPGGTGDAGMGIFPNEFRQYSDNPNADITFGYDSYSTGFSEKVRFEANGMVGIGTATPVLSTGSSGIVAQNNTYIQLRVQSSASAAGMEFKPSTGNQYEIQADNTNNWFVYNRNANAYRLFINGSGFVGIGTNNPTQALQVVGNILASGTITPSDIRYKKNIQPIQSPIEKLEQLNGVTYKYRKEEFPQMGFTDKEQIGLIAQEVEKVFPQLVVTDNKGFKAVDYVKLVPVLLEGMKVQQSELIQQQSVNRSLQDQIDELKKLISHSEK
jgi:hypothetical protein